jgi:hypothetical protein
MATKTRPAESQAARSSGRKSADKPVATKDAAAKEVRDTYSTTIRLPFLTAHFAVPKPPTLRGAAHRVGSFNRVGAFNPVGSFNRPVQLGPVAVPAPSKSLYYAGLGALAVAEVVEWPIAVAIGAGTYVAQHTRGDRPAVPHLEHHEGPGDGTVPDQRADEPA